MLAASLLITGSIVLVGQPAAGERRIRVVELGGRDRGGDGTARVRQPAPTRRSRRGAGRAFARFETRFQVAWVIGALVGIVPQNEKIGMLILAISLAVGGILYVGRAASSTRAPDAHHVATTGRRPGAGSRDGRVPSTLESNVGAAVAPRSWIRPTAERYFQPPVAPRTMPNGPAGQRKQSVMSSSTCSRVAMPSSTTRLASRIIAKYTRFATKPQLVGVSFTTIGFLPHFVASGLDGGDGLLARLRRAHDLGEAASPARATPSASRRPARAGRLRRRARRSGSPTCSTRGSWPAARRGRGRGTRAPSARGARAWPRSRRRRWRQSSNESVNVSRSSAASASARVSLPRSTALSSPKRPVVTCSSRGSSASASMS